MADSKKKVASSAHSSSTESLNSIPVSSDGEDPLELKKDKPKKEPKKRSKERRSNSGDNSAEAASGKKPPPLPPRPTRASTIDFTERKQSVKRQKQVRTMAFHPKHICH